VTDRRVRNIAHSVRQRLRNEARRTGRLYNEIEQYYAMERFLYRLSQSEHGAAFVLKGALLFRLWHGGGSRPTRDIDLLGRPGNTEETIARVFGDVCSQNVPPDGLVFEPSSVTTAAITEDADYGGVRVNVRGRLGTSRIRIQVDVGFSDVVVPPPGRGRLPGDARLPAASSEGIQS